jgi:L-amino acid N-acyltransferase YncA
MPASIRFAQRDDLPRMVEIYNQAVARENATADTEPTSVEARTEWFNQHCRDRFPIYVCEADRNVTGWLSLSQYRNGRRALEATAEVSYYVDYAQHGKGIASALLEHALSDCRRIKKRILFAIILDVNVPSIKLLQKFGFEQWGFMPDVAEFSTGLCGHLYYGKRM